MIGMTVCSGIGAPEVSAQWIDWRYQSEIEKFPCAVLAHRFPDAVNLGDMTKFKEWPDATVDVLCGGTPCQSFSVAGLRKGLADPRGNLMLTFLAISERYAPRWIVWENVPGVLSSNGGRDFGTFLGALGQLGYGWAYRVLDAQHVRTQRHPWAVPQRRRRVFVVGYLGSWERAGAVLFDRESLRGDPAPRRETRKGVAACAAHGVAIRGREGGGTAELTGDIATALRASSGGGDKPHALISPVASPVAPTMRAGGNDTGGNRPYGTDADTCDSLIAEPVAPTISARPTGGGGLGADFDCDGGLILSHDPAVTLTARDYKGPLPEAGLSTVVAHSLRGEGFDASEDGTGRGTPLVPVAFSSKDYGGDAMENVAPTLRAGGHDGSHANAGVPPAIAIQERAVSDNLDAGPQGKGRQEDHAYTLEARNTVQAVAFDLNQITSPTNQSAPDPAVHHTLPATSTPPHLAAPYAVRRLTPVECERLQGFPDGWTAIPYRGKPADQCPDGPRYKALGNSWATNCGKLIFDRIRAVEAMA